MSHLASILSIRLAGTDESPSLPTWVISWGQNSTSRNILYPSMGYLFTKWKDETGAYSRIVDACRGNTSNFLSTSCCPVKSPKHSSLCPLAFDAVCYTSYATAEGCCGSSHRYCSLATIPRISFEAAGQGNRIEGTGTGCCVGCNCPCAGDLTSP